MDNFIQCDKIDVTVHSRLVLHYYMYCGNKEKHSPML